MILRLIPIILVYIALAAHFSRHGSDLIAVIVLVLPFLLFIRKRWVIRVLQIVAYIGAVEWIRSAYIFIDHRMAMNEPWTRLLLILSMIILFTVYIGYLLGTEYFLQKYPAAEADLPDEGDE